ncbi:MAG: SUMF1/EgtB/PvdO family nonheme iron enzyme [Deltaproteobacteria bacterium]|nr:SUMF1/EgtB/PvdO family nonheme iron enzyme [Deltaproteobacteria bacterium]
MLVAALAGVAVVGAAALVAVLVRSPVERPARSVATKSAARAPVAAVPAGRQAQAAEKKPPEGMVAVAAGSYVVGCASGNRQCWDDERPAHRVALGRFGIMVHEVTMEQYDECAAAGRCPPAGKEPGCTWQREGEDRHPINCVSWKAAGGYCAWRGWRLPSEAEWEAAARGPSQADYPWGSEPASCERALVGSERGGGCGAGGLLPVGSRQADRSWVGAFDLGGSVREWTASEYAAYPGGKAEAEQRGKVNRGASWLMEPGQASTSHTRFADEPGAARLDLGFRCAVDL